MFDQYIGKNRNIEKTPLVKGAILSFTDWEVQTKTLVGIHFYLVVGRPFGKTGRILTRSMYCEFVSACK